MPLVDDEQRHIVEAPAVGPEHEIQLFGRHDKYVCALNEVAFERIVVVCTVHCRYAKPEIGEYL